MRAVPKGLLGLLLMVVTTIVPRAATAEDFPIIFENAQEARKIGFVISGYGPGGDTVRPERINCYVYGSATYEVTFSKQVLRAFEVRGFTLQSMCFGLISLVRFDPETGRRLPTFVIVDRASAEEDLAANPDGIGENDTVSRNATTPEWPLSLPDCYVRAVPLLDCQWRFHPYTGDELSAEVAGQMSELGRQIHQIMATKLENGVIPTPAARPGPVIQRLSEGLFPVIDLNEAGLSSEVYQLVEPIQFDMSEGFQARYGYALNTESSGGPPSISALVIKQALDKGKPASQLRIDRIKALIGK